jgi:methionyl-tRNA formyltransferase
MFGYRKIIDKKILSKLNNPPINLHMSYLPYNKGSHPNFWSFYDNTPAGITIHEVSEKLDSGKIIYQKKIKFKLNNKSTFYSTYKILFNEIEKLFCRHYKKIINNNYKSMPQINKGTFHIKKNLPTNLIWKDGIFKYFDNLK